MILTIIFSLGTVVASENIDDASSSGDSYLSIENADNQCLMSNLNTGSNDAQGSVSGLDTVDDEDYSAISGLDSKSEDVQLSDNGNADDELENQNVLNGKNLIKDGSDTTEDTDLSVDMELGDIERNVTGFNQYSFGIPLIINVSVSNGIAKNAKVNITIPDDFEIMSYALNAGTYDSSTGIWDIGDLDSSTIATLTIYTKLTEKGTFDISVNATTDSNDVNLTNNDIQCTITASSKITSNTTRTSDNQGGPQHNPDDNSDPGNGIINVNGDDPNWGDDPFGGNSDSPNIGDNPGNGGNTNQNNGGNSNQNNGQGTNTNNGGNSNQNNGQGTNTNNGGNSNQNNGGNSENNGGGTNTNGDGSSNSGNNNLLKSVDSNILTKATKSFGNTLNNIFNLGSDDNEVSNASLKTVKAINAYDYTQIPIMIFMLFLVALAGIIAYDKIKS